MSEIWKLAAFLLLPAALATWKHSKLVSLALWIPFVVTELALRGMVDVSAQDHPVRVVVPAIGMLLGTASTFMESAQGRRTSRASALGAVAFVSGLADIAALPVFNLLEEWVCPPIQVFFCLVTIFIGVWPKERRLPWLSTVLES